MLARALVAAALVLLLPAAASAQVTATASAQAAELFEEGRALVVKQDYRSACPKFVDSVKLEPKVGTLLNLADCEEHLGQIVAARGHWQDAASLARSVNDERGAVAQQRFAALDPRVAKLRVTLASPASGLRVTRDGVELGAGSLGSALPVDPGAHTIVVSGGGFADRSYPLTLADGETREIAVEPGAPLVLAGPLEASHSWSGRKTLAVVAAGAGAAGVVVGSIFGLLTVSENNASNSSGGCVAGKPMCTLPAGVDDRSSAYRNGNISTAAFVVGGVGLAAGAVLWFTAPHSSSMASRAPYRPAIAVGPGSLIVRGQF